MPERNDVLSQMKTATSGFEGKASPGNQQEIANHLLASGFTVGHVADNLHDLMLHLGHDEQHA